MNKILNTVLLSIAGICAITVIIMAIVYPILNQQTRIAYQMMGCATTKDSQTTQRCQAVMTNKNWALWTALATFIVGVVAFLLSDVMFGETVFGGFGGRNSGYGTSSGRSSGYESSSRVNTAGRNPYSWS